MKKSVIKLLGGIIVLVFIHYSCGSDKNKADYLPELKAEIPASLKDNPEAVTFIENSTDALNQWSITMEDLVVECEPFVNKDESELTTMDKMKLGKAMMEFTANMGKFAVKMAEMEQTATMIEDGMDEQEMEALATVMDSFEKRMQEINEKYADFGKEEQQ